MKRFIITLTAIVAFFGLTSCQKEASKALVGIWQATTMEMSINGLKMEVDMEDAGMGVEFTFRENGSGSISGTSEADDIELDFIYSVDGETLVLDAEGEIIEIPFTLEKKNLSMILDGEIFDETGVKVTVHFVKM